MDRKSIQRLIVLMNEFDEAARKLLEEKSMRDEIRKELEDWMQQNVKLRFKLEGLKGLLNEKNR